MADDETLETRQKENTCSTGDGHKRAPKYTEKGLEEHLHRQMNVRRTKLSQLTAKTNKINALMKDNEDPDTVDDHLNECSKLLNDFDKANEDVLRLLSPDEKEADQTYWFLPKREHFSNFMVDVEKWTISARQQQQDDVGPDDIASMSTRQQQQDDVGPDDSVSIATAPKKRPPSSCISEGRISSCSARSKASSTSSVRHKEQAERAALLAKAASLKAKQALEMEELKLKAKKEQLEIETAIAASTAKIKGMTIRPLVELLAVKKKKDSKGSINEEIHTQFLDHLLTGIEGICGHYGHHHWKDKLNRFNKTYVKKWLIAGDRSTEPQLISFYNKMEMKQAMMMVESGSSAKLTSTGSSVSLQNIQQKAPARKRAIPSISKTREEEIRKILRSNLQNTRQRLRSYSRHDLFIDPLEDNMSEIRFRKKRVEMERRLSHYLTVPANRHETAPVRKVWFEPEHKVYTYDDSESPRGRAAQPDPGSLDAVSLLDESPKRSRQSSTLKAEGAAEQRSKESDDQEEQLKLSRCLSDPGPNKEDDEDDAFLSMKHIPRT